MKLTKKLKIYFLVLIVGISLISIDGYMASKDEVEFTPKYSHCKYPTPGGAALIVTQWGPEADLPEFNKSKKDNQNG